jgi:outer membrane cobalamin receptor
MLSVDISIFRIEIEDMLDSYYDKDGDYAGKQNIGKSRQQGMEASFSGSFVENRIRYKVGYTYTDARYVDSYAKDYDKNIVSIDDNRLSKIPYNRVNIDLDTTLLKRNDYQLEWHVGMMTQDDYPMDKLNTDDYQAYTLVDSKMTLKYKGFEYFIAVDNLFDEDYDNYAYISSGKEYYYPAADQTWTTGVVFEF